MQTVERRRARRVWVAGVAVLRGGAQPPSVWRVGNLSLGGASLLGEGALAGRLAMSLHVAGFPDMELTATLVRRQLSTRAGRCAVRFVDVSDGQRQLLRDILAADHSPAHSRRARCWSSRTTSAVPRSPPSSPRSGSRCATRPLPDRRRPGCSGRARRCCWWTVASWRWIGWSLLQFARDTAPEMRRFVLAEDVRGFRLYFALKAGLVDGLVEPQMPRDTLARHLLGG